MQKNPDVIFIRLFVIHFHQSFANYVPRHISGTPKFLKSAAKFLAIIEVIINIKHEYYSFTEKYKK